MRDKKKILEKEIVKEDTFFNTVYLLFFIILPIVYSETIIDPVLLPRQLFLTIFLIVILVKIYFHKESFFLYGSTLFKRIVFLGVLGFAFVTLIAAFFAYSKSEAFYVTSKYFIEIVYFLVTFFLLVNKKITLNTLQKSALLFVSVIVFITFFQMLSLHELGEELIHNTKLTATSANKNLVSSILYLSLPFLITFIWLKSLSKLWKYFALFNLVSVLCILYVLQTKTVFISVIVFLVCFIILLLFVKFFRKVRLKFSRISLLIISFLVLLSIVFSFYFTQNDFVRQYVNKVDEIGEVVLNNVGGDDNSADVLVEKKAIANSKDLLKKSFHTFDLRLSLWNNSYQMFKEHSIIGVGPGNWQIFYPKYGLNTIDDKAVRDGFTTYQRPHNDWLWIVSELGIFGLIFYLLVVIFSIMYLVKNSFESTEVSEVRTNLLFASAIVGFMFIYLADFPLERIEHQVLFYSILAYALYVKVKSFSSDVTLIKRYKLPVIIVLIVICILSMVVTISRLTGEQHTRQLKIAHLQSDWNTMISESTSANSVFYKLDPLSIPIDWYKGVALFSLNDFSSACISFQNAYNQHPYNIHVINDLASCYEKLKQHDKAILYYRKALKVSAGFDEARLNLSAVYFNIKRYKSAFMELKKCDSTTQNPKYKLFLPSITKQFLHLDNLPDSTITSIFQKYKK